jgi:hypothetical protein
MDLLSGFSPQSTNGTSDSTLMYNKLGMNIGPTYFWFIASLRCEISRCQRCAVMSGQLNFWEKLRMAVSCSHSKNEPMSHSECKNVTTSLIQTCDIVSVQLSSLNKTFIIMNGYKTKEVGPSGDNSDLYLRLPGLNFGQDSSLN